MRFAVIGAGAVGSYFGARLIDAGQDVSFVARGATLQALHDKGLSIITEGRRDTVTVQATDDAANIGNVDYVISAVKATQVIDALEPAGALIGSDTAVITTQNGVDGPRLTASVVGREHTIPGVVKAYVAAREPGVTEFRGGPGSLEVAEWTNEPSERVTALRKAFEDAGIGSPVPRDVWELLWAKSMFVVPPGGLGAITGLPLGELLSRQGLRRVLIDATTEIRDVAVARGVDMPYGIVADTVAFDEAQPPSSTTSMQRDIMSGRPSELDPQLGAIVRYGREAGVPTPLHELMYEVLKLRRNDAQ
ncbi:2-dehydropantoate 2-reductase [Propionibacterium freudenreichii]|uniref:2-dehydropantoate 2-reductase n=1 Tax=Propionibacterium freudenreichii TaxID=1744 RepID=UPI0024342174|nr:2-dehydropantoate 2-reductase [Propionibacterium freudenreichii]MDK9301333.1 2-dehydropantoate 2-reductase [Propionibacterium freudenreichii]MDK9320643.1 2-dehydropantoate 2-reductase [Propionibacterium freudenreichii]MDK9324457.1 2-dehydropantoate 2-reductase [Propionibacterium freudenreichii]MDK9339675.1 2-dehydropantoate 2-reductase [Propionibacterium freudenreichii]MDK9648222.1 2-dehydropantoate 2-reductase [Propionibacterium freudenreichii]